MTELAPAQAEREWKAAKFRPVYLLVGEEASAKAAFAQRLKAALKPDDFNLNEVSMDSAEGIQDAVSAALTPPMLSERRLVVIRGPKLGAPERKALAEYLKDPLASTTLVASLDERKPDMRDALTAAAASLGGLVLFRPMNENEAAGRLREASEKAGAPIDSEAARLLVGEAGTDWGILQAELDKLLLFAKGRGRIIRDDVIACLGFKKASNPFDFPRLLQARDRVQTLRQLRRLLAEGVEPFRIVYQISGAIQKQLKAKRLAASGKAEGQIFRELRLNDYYDRDFMRQLALVSEKRLIAELRACAELEARLKSKSWLDSGIELEWFVAGMGAG